MTGIWKGADFMEREVYDLMGITFVGHPDLRRILAAGRLWRRPPFCGKIFPRKDAAGAANSVHPGWTKPPEELSAEEKPRIGKTSLSGNRTAEQHGGGKNSC